MQQLKWILFVLLLAVSVDTAARQAVGGSPRTAPPPGAPASPQPPRSGTGAISGVVTDGTTSRPIAGAVVYLGRQGYGPVGRLSRQVTDAKGRFVFGELPASDLFFLNVSKAGYRDGRYGDTGPVSSGIASGLIRLIDGQWFGEANIPLWRPGAIAGVVRDERGEPMVGVYVRALARIVIAGLPHLAAGVVAQTDDRGRYRISGLEPGAYLVSVPSVQNAVPAMTTATTIEGLTPQAAADQSGGETRRNNGALPLDPDHLLIIGNYVTPPPAANGQPQAYPITFHPGVTTIAGAATVDLRNGDTREGVDIALRPAAVVRVSGRVAGPPESVRGLVLRLVANGLEDLGDGSEVATALAGPNGDFMFLNVPAGEYTLVASKATLEYNYGPSRSLSLPGTPGLVPGPGTFLGGVPSGPPSARASGSHAAGDNSHWARMPLSVGSTDVRGVSVVMRKAVTLRGRVAFEGDNPPGITSIIAEPADGSAWLGLQHASTRPAIGDAFEIPGLMPGEYVLRFVGITPRHAVKSIVASGIDYTTRPFDASAGQDIDDVVITYTDRVASITGSVQGETTGRMLSVVAFPAARDQWTRYGLSAARFKTAPVSNGGLFKIENIPAGDYLLVAVDTAQSRRWQEQAFLDAAAKVAVRVTAAWGEARSQDLKASVIK